MNQSTPLTQSIFYAKTWYLYVAAIVSTMLAIFCVVLGPLFLFDILKRADGKPGTEAGVAMSIIAVPLMLVALLGWFNIYARRAPLLQIFKEGLQINIVGASSIDGIPLLPNLLRVAWLIVSLKGFKKQTGWIAWDMLREVKVLGTPMMRSLMITGTIANRNSQSETSTTVVANGISFRDAEFQDALDVIASSIRAFHEDPNRRAILPSLHDQ